MTYGLGMMIGIEEPHRGAPMKISDERRLLALELSHDRFSQQAMISKPPLVAVPDDGEQILALERCDDFAHSQLVAQRRCKILAEAINNRCARQELALRRAEAAQHLISNIAAQVCNRKPERLPYPIDAPAVGKPVARGGQRDSPAISARGDDT